MTMKSILRFGSLMLIFPILSIHAATFRNSAHKETDLTPLTSRKLQVDGIRDFVPLSCNANLGSATCTSWSSKFGTSTSYSTRVVIPCGECVTMDVTGGSLSLLGGLEILGKLVFPDGYKLNLSANIVIVQGELEMTATKTVDGIPNIKLTMIGSNDFAFTPVDSNARACDGNNTCPVGKKGIIVAGGKVNIHGLPSSTLAWTRLYDVVGTSNNPSTILVPSTVIGKWGVGSEIAITSHTRVWNETQVRTITAVASSNGFAALTLNSPILRPTTMSESPDFAVEVALLSRNIRFEGGPDSNSRHGGHFLVYHTPTVVQTIEGVDFYNFGQQGNLGKYPIHFHLCTDVPGSIVSKNTIRQSNQRCVVVHGTNKLRIQENVAFDTKGHCYMTEDGIENDNEFIRNLGAQTGIPATIIPNSGPNGVETDGEPATFWITNPTNSWIGNVAAGSEHSGYWFEPKLRGTRASAFPGLDPQTAPLIAFQDNVAHSNMAGRLGAIRMYVPGYFPTSLTSFSGLKIYRNDAVGMFIHRCENILLENSLFADNNIGVDHDRSEGIVLRNLKIIGQSPLYGTLMARQPGVEPVCFRNERIGIDLHTWQKEIEVYAGAKISNVDISGFSPSDPNCATPSSVRFDILNLKQGLFESYYGFEGITDADGPDTINMCVINEVEYDYLYFIDLDGSFRPNTSTTASVSTLIASDNKAHTRFLDGVTCIDNAAGCYSYCPNVCFRSVRYVVTGPGQASYKLKVCRADDSSRCSLFKGGRRGTSGPHEFTAHLPPGKYTAVFLDSTGQVITPTTVVGSLEHTYCPVSQLEVTMAGAGLSPISPVSSAPVGAVAPVAPRPAPVRPPAMAPAPVAPGPTPVAPRPAPVRAPSAPIGTGSTPVRAPAPTRKVLSFLDILKKMLGL